ncbi:Coatomer subunit beta'-2 [Nymphaea thermarum]|nr:Coatomer subunit beta'-2 [Nymphaea thermarum]
MPIDLSPGHCKASKGLYPPAEEYLSYWDRRQTNLVEAFKSMQIGDETVMPMENGDFIHEEAEEVEEEEAVEEEGQDEVVDVEAEDSTDSAVLVNGNESDEQWGMNNKGTPSA